MIKIFTLFICLITLTSCGHTIAAMNGITVTNPYDTSAVISNSSINYDRHKNLTTILGPVIFAQNNLLGHRYNLRAFTKGQKLELPSEVQLYIVSAHEGWYFLDTAYHEGKKLPVLGISRDAVSCAGSSLRCQVSETIGVDLSIQEIEKRIKANKNYDIVISGRKGEIAISVPPAYFDGYIRLFQK